MFMNEKTAVHTDRIVLVPYCAHHVPTYHDWMKDPDIRFATASEKLSLQEEYAMQKSWRVDADKLTFITCMPFPQNSAHDERSAEIAAMIGDVNMFVNVHEGEDGCLSLVGELELMIAVKQFQRKGYGRAALLAFLVYVLSHEKEITAQHPGNSTTNTNEGGLDYLMVKIGETNERSIRLFESLGFMKTSEVPNFFGEFELHNKRLLRQSVEDLTKQYGLQSYKEAAY